MQDMRQTLGNINTNDVTIKKCSKHKIYYYVSSLICSGVSTLLLTIYLQNKYCDGGSLFCPSYENNGSQDL